MRRALVAAVAVAAGVVALGAAAQSTAEAPRVILCPRFALGAGGVEVGITAASRCHMKFQLPLNFNAIVARNKDNGATVVRVDCPVVDVPNDACVPVVDGVQIDVAVPYPTGFPAVNAEFHGEIVGFRPATENDDPTIVHPSNAAPFVETVPQGYYIPAWTVSQFIAAFVGFGG